MIHREHDETERGQVLTEAVSRMAVNVDVPVLLVVRAAGQAQEYGVGVGEPLGQNIQAACVRCSPDPTPAVTSNDSGIGMLPTFNVTGRRR
ncbi:MAG: hypothetical protein QOD39_1000 [Mycobacterium sp.]|jgi:hypothetical protein|nr:hypothetical protein [Mycobacterium sp.]